MSEDKNAFPDWLRRRFIDPIAQIEDRDHAGLVLGRSEAEIAEDEDDEGALEAL